MVLLRHDFCHVGRLLFEELASLVKEMRLQLSHLPVIGQLNLMRLLSHQLLQVRFIKDVLAIHGAQIGVRARMFATLKAHHAHATST